MTLLCQDCGSVDIRRAHLRFSDATRLLMFRYPVRCRECRKRWHAALQKARLLPNAPDRRERAEKLS